MMGEPSSRMLRGTNSGSNKSGFSPSTSQRPSRTPPESGDGSSRGLGMAMAADARVLTDSDLAARHDVVLQDSGTIVMLEVPGEGCQRCALWGSGWPSAISAPPKLSQPGFLPQHVQLGRVRSSRLGKCASACQAKALLAARQQTFTALHEGLQPQLVW